MQDWTPREHYTAEDLVEIIRILRDREDGCPWDKVQTHASIRKKLSGRNVRGAGSHRR